MSGGSDHDSECSEELKGLPITDYKLQHFICAQNWMSPSLPAFFIVVQSLAQMAERVYEIVGGRMNDQGREDMLQESVRA